jgi:hypothetical protein
MNKPSEEELDSNSNQTTDERETIDIEQGNLFTMESENKSFYLPKGWTPKKDLDENYIEYSTPTSRLYKEDGIYKAIFNLSQTRILEDYSYIKFILDSYNQ